MIDPHFIASKAKIGIDIAQALLDGVDRDGLSSLLGSDGAPAAVVGKRRMNLIGSLRSIGFDVTGGRRGGNVYRILSYDDPSSKIVTTIDSFNEEQRAILAEIDTWEPFSSKQADVNRFFYSLWGALSLSPLNNRAHEKSLLQMLCYDVSKNRAFIVSRGVRLGVVIQRFTQKPAFKLLPGTLSFEETVSIAEMLQKVSFRKVKVAYIPDEWVAGFKDLGWAIETSQEAILDIKRFANHPESWAGKKGPKELRRFEKDTRLYRVDNGDTLIEQVIEEWRKINEPKQRQLAIVRDYLSFLITIPSSLKFLSLREGLPVAVMILDAVCGPEADSTVAQVTEKSLNYRESLGGRSGTSDYNLWATCRALDTLGYRWLNTGHIHGSEQGLAERKTRLADEILTVSSANLHLDKFFQEEI